MNESLQQTIERISKPIRYAAAAALGLLALFLLVKTIDVLAYGIGRSDTYPSNVITVEGMGEVSVVPDIASISFSVTESGTVVGEAQTKATTKTDAALAFLKNAGVEEKDIKTSSYNVYPKYDSQTCYSGVCPSYTPRIIGYEVSQSIEVKVRDTAKVGEVLQGLGSTGVQNIYGPNFTVDDEDAVKSEAREAAIKEAREKAELLAKQLGVRLGKVVSFYENTGAYPMYDKAYGYGGMTEAAISSEAPRPSLPAGENETSVSVSITYEIK